MIDIGLTKLAVIGVVALVVIGPEKLPTVARMAGSLFGRAQRYINEVKSEVSREIELEGLRKMQKDVQDAASGFEDSVSRTISDTKDSLHAAWDDNLTDTPLVTGNVEQLARKAKNFRKKKLAKNSAIPGWYKSQNGRKARVISGAARVAKYRPAGRTKNNSSFYA
ncbi:Sec-independent protein translocase protein TatB [Glaciimonas sp. CA11.2]|uniref:Sec-independent protein translocase protein TatB n=1 Tax=unclassified Glaciimonas TaxID=2644401 RepID=UPI002AB577F4|nr:MULTISPECIES: Sec-independent protein translocase protein TatB [unclassified Glaciimonas]MDY7546594.1 Sec-independent protein translocase protein TatB [Glaciimonas sp. CA11.2]MEB0011720.1 Sec-independent protein translocase protein TatB [Glaciimonas sp. Cout2]MEB0080724.1 Sec-independent protein translocase protein TatB [Glaciimonas sp. Gout2]MEB0163914.1 Sec-independent protein translocase protein TatB [Glaciimonas sp. CA11.2]